VVSVDELDADVVGPVVGSVFEPIVFDSEPEPPPVLPLAEALVVGVVAEPPVELSAVVPDPPSVLPAVIVVASPQAPTSTSAHATDHTLEIPRPLIPIPSCLEDLRAVSPRRSPRWGL
jgi:hypothetical protein